jgi:uncharacterized membrane protein
VLLRQELIRRLARYMPPFMLLPIVASPAAMILCRSRVSLWLDAVGLVLLLAAVGITLAVNAPLNRRFTKWSAEGLPPDWQRHVHRWGAGHTARTTTALAAFGCAVLAGK